MATSIPVASASAVSGATIDSPGRLEVPSETGAQLIVLDQTRFIEQFQRFQSLILMNDAGRAFTDFHEGLADDWEGYKPELRKHALGILLPSTWAEAEIGSGAILRRTIRAIEIQNSDGLTNNLVFWQNRFGHAKRDHHVLLDAVSNADSGRDLERLLFGLYRGNGDEGTTFDRLSELTKAKYPLLGYLYFLKDMDRFMPIRSRTFDRAFRDLGIDLITARNCSWENYQRYNTALGTVQGALAALDGLATVRLIDAHSFCWMLEKLDDSGREQSIIEMCQSVEDTVRSANGQIVTRLVKSKELRMTRAELEELLRFLLDRQGDRCALTGIRFHFSGPNVDNQLRPSVDRIDSNGHYEVGNLQIVCRFVNFWKRDSDNEEFKRLLILVQRERSERASDITAAMTGGLLG